MNATNTANPNIPIHRPEVHHYDYVILTKLASCHMPKGNSVIPVTIKTRKGMH